MSRYSVVLAVVVTVVTIFSYSSQAHANIVPTWLSAWWYDITGQEQSEIKNKDYEPYATKRDECVNKLLAENSISFKAFKDQVIFEKDEVVKNDGDPYVVYTPYMKTWKEKFKTMKYCLAADENLISAALGVD